VPAIDPRTAQQIQYAAVRRGELLVWTVYDHPTDHPLMFIARPHLTTPGQEKPLPFYLEATSLQTLRLALPAGLTRIERFPADDPKITETWI
jgi:hypothetical protein